MTRRLLLLVCSLCLMTGMAAAVPCDGNGDGTLTASELATAILDSLDARFMGGTVEAPSSADLRDAAFVYTHWDGRALTITDTSGRTTTLTRPLNRIALFNSDAIRMMRSIGLEPDRVVVAGVRDLDPPEREYAVASGLALIEGWPPDVIARISESLRSAGVSRLYVHVDVDVFDPEDYGDALFSVPGGPSLREVAQAVRSLVDSFDVAGVGVVESRGREPEARRKLVAFMNDSGLLPVI